MPGKIPHDPIQHRAIHLTYRLVESIPRDIVTTLKERRERKLHKLESSLLGLPEPLRTEQFNRNAFDINSAYELAIDEALHITDYGPRYLAQPDVANVVLNSWHFIHDRDQIFVYAVCVMSNHVHVVLQAPPGVERVDMGKLVQSHKSFTAREANRLLDRTGSSLWEDLYFDRRVRRGKFMRVMWYVLNNPKKSGLVADWMDWPYTHVHPEYRPMFTGTLDD